MATGPIIDPGTSPVITPPQYTPSAFRAALQQSNQPATPSADTQAATLAASALPTVNAAGQLIGTTISTTA